MNSGNNTTKAETLRRFITAPAIASAMSLLDLRRNLFRPVSGMGGATGVGRERNNMKNKTIPMILGLTVALALPVVVLSAKEKKPGVSSGQRPPVQDRFEGGPGGQRPEGQDRGPEGQGRPGGPGQRPMPPLIAALDANRDGVVDADEIANAPAALKKLDKNGDGKLTMDELRPPRPEGGPDRGGPQRGGPERGQFPPDRSQDN